MSNPTKSEPKTGWHQIHDFLRGFGWRWWDRDGIDGASDKVIYREDVAHFFGLNIFREGLDLDDIYEKLQPLLAAEREERLRKLKERGPIDFKKFSIPKVNREYPQL